MSKCTINIGDDVYSISLINDSDESVVIKEIKKYIKTIYKTLGVKTVNTILCKSTMDRFLDTFYTLVDSGVPMKKKDLKALVKASLSNSIFISVAEAFESCEDYIDIEDDHYGSLDVEDEVPTKVDDTDDPIEGIQ